jgi:hypothetical protein
MVKLNGFLYLLIIIILKLKQTPWSRFILEKLVVTQVVEKFPAFHGTGSFITVFTRSCHWSLS